MKHFTRLLRCMASAMLALMLSPANGALAEPRDYRFEAVQPLIDSSRSNLVEVRLVHAPSGRIVDEAIIRESRLVMPMQGMGAMKSRVTLVPWKPGAGAYSFAVSAPMTGEWLLVIAANVPGEKEVVHGTVPIYVQQGESLSMRKLRSPEYEDEQ